MHALDGKALAQEKDRRPTPSVRIAAVFALTLANLLIPSVAARAGEPAAFSTPAQVVPAEASLSGLIDLPVAKAAAPVISSISPTKASAGAGTPVTITGSGFGTHDGNATVLFLYKPATTEAAVQYIPANSIADDDWTDTRIVCEVPVDSNAYLRSAGSGPVMVLDSDGHASNDVDLSVSFGFMWRWATPVVKFRVVTSDAGWREMVKAAAKTWNKAGSAFRLDHASTGPAKPFLGDGVNEIYWDYVLEPTTARTEFLPNPQAVTDGPSETDIVFNKSLKWGSLVNHKYDVQTVALHEMGHVLGLRDLYGTADKGKVMYGHALVIGMFGRNRKLSADDIAGVKWIYPSSPTPRPGEPFSVFTGVGWQRQPAIPGNTVVWSDDHRDDNIYGYDLAKKREFPICTAAGSQTEPAISGNTVVWTDYRNGNSDIYGYDLAKKREFPICTAAGDQLAPAISGNTVVWADGRNNTYFGGSGYDIYGYDMAEERESPIYAATGNQGSPSISGNTVIWSDSRRWGDIDIYGFDLAEERELPICTAPSRQNSPVISGNTVVWVDNRRTGDWGGDLFGYDLAQGRELPICTVASSPSEYTYSPAIWCDTVVWEDDRDDMGDIYGVTLGP